MASQTRGLVKSLRQPENRLLSALLAEARENAGLTQEKLAKRLKRPQSFVAKYEGGERRLDIVEFIGIARAIGIDPVRLMRQLIRQAEL